MFPEILVAVLLQNFTDFIQLFHISEQSTNVILNTLRA